jgi:hypothetical protein
LSVEIPSQPRQQNETLSLKQNKQTKNQLQKQKRKERHYYLDTKNKKKTLQEKSNCSPTSSTNIYAKKKFFFQQTGNRMKLPQPDKGHL